MNSPLEQGLFLPIRFYSSLTEQNRYKRISTGVSLVDETYVYVDCVSLAPFQIILDSFCDSGLFEVTFNLICTDTESVTTLPYNPEHWEWYVDSTNQRIYFSYLGNDDFTDLLYNGKYYIQLIVEDTCEQTDTYYSDVFVIKNCAVPYDNNEYRITSANQNDKRLVDLDNLNNLRITK